jgi:serine/threonine protein kinase
MVVFVCSHCGRKIQVQQDRIGQKVQCSCGQVVTVSIGTRTPAPAAGEETTALPAHEEPKRGTISEIETRGNGGAKAALAKELYDFLDPPQAAGEIGRCGHYRVLNVLGSGGMGIVFQAEDPLLKRHAAIKAMKPALASSESARARFIREAIAIAAIKHDHIVTIYQVSKTPRDVPYLVMEFLEGEALDARLRREGALPVAEVVRIGREIAEGLAAAHQRGLIHRDIKPANIWLEGERRRVKILDFGLARAVAEDAQITQSGIILGTPAYMAPEQARSAKVDARSDLFSLGCVLYHLATGRMPFQGRDTMSMLMALAVDTPPPPQELRADIPSPLSELIQQLLAKNADDRPASAQEVVQRLRQIEEGASKEARPIPVAKIADLPTVLEPAEPSRVRREKPARTRKRKSRPTCCCLAVVLLLMPVGLGGVLLVLSLFYAGQSHTTGGNRAEDMVKKLAKMANEFAELEREPGEWLSLFDGKSREGWEVVGEGEWNVVDGILTADGKGVGWLASRRSFADFELELQYRLPIKGNSGVFLRARKDAPVDGSDFLEIQLLDDSHHGDFPPITRNGALFNEAEPSGAAHGFAERWMRLNVKAEGQTIRVWIDGSPVLFHQTRRPEKSGRIGLQMFDTPVEFRNIRARELSPRN